MADEKPKRPPQQVVIVPRAMMTPALYHQSFPDILALAARTPALRVLECEPTESFLSRAADQPLRRQYLTHSPEKGNHMASEDLTGFAVLRGDPKTGKTFLLAQGY